VNEQGDSEHELRCGGVVRLPMRSCKEQRKGPEDVLLIPESSHFPLQNVLAIARE